MARKLELDEAGWVNGRGYRKQVVADTAVLAAPGVFVQVVEMAPGESIPNHSHQTSREFYAVQGGRCRLVVNGESRRLEPGDMLLMEPGDVHSLHNDGDELFRLLVFKTNAATEDTFWTQSSPKSEIHNPQAQGGSER
ncbi:MAG: cupin domain-containing protein [Ardenticatenaceae bacterium]|nr:cupin domain-containing protein [Ardenticatenaceae bacterium]MCB8986500.1 cupin domain-containing protein [Ardenticatenaceae bacterium]